MNSLSLPSLPSLPAVVATLGALTLGSACNDPTSKEQALAPTYSPTSMGDTPCEALGMGESTAEGQLSGVFILGDWANRVQSALASDGVTVKIFPNDYEPFVCYGSDEVTPQADGSLRFNFPSPSTNRGEEWKVAIAYSETVYDTYEDAGYTDPAGNRFENWELACFDENSDSRPEGNYGYVFDKAPNAPRENLTVPGAVDGWDCDLRFIAQ